MTHQIKISERESEAFPLSSWGCSLQRPPSGPPPARGPALLCPRAAFDGLHSLPNQLTALLRVFCDPEGVEETARLELPSRWSSRISFGRGPRAASALSGIPELKPAVWISVQLAWRPWLRNRESPQPSAWARGQALPYLRRPGAASSVPGERLQRKQR